MFRSKAGYCVREHRKNSPMSCIVMTPFLINRTTHLALGALEAQEFTSNELNRIFSNSLSLWGLWARKSNSARSQLWKMRKKAEKWFIVL